MLVMKSGFIYSGYTFSLKIDFKIFHILVHVHLNYSYVVNNRLARIRSVH